MKKLQNESQADRAIRIIVGAILALASYLYAAGTLQVVLYVVAFILLATGITGVCLIYKALGIKTNK